MATDITFVDKQTVIPTDWNQNVNDSVNLKPGSTLGNLLAADTGSSLVGFKLASAGAVLRTVQDKLGDSMVSVEDFGAVGDGVTNDRASFAAAFAESNVVALTPGKTYWLGNVTDNSPIFTFSGANKVIAFNGAKVTLQTSGGNFNAPLFQLNNINGFTLLDPDVEDFGFDINIDFKGISVVRLSPTTGPIYNVQIRRARFKSLVSPLDCVSADNEARRVWFDGDCYNTYYGIALTSNGHDLTADIRTFNAIRSYFVVGVRNHVVRCVSVNHNSRGNADFLLKSVDSTYPLRNVTGHFTSVNSFSTTNPQLVFESHGSLNPLIEDVDITYNDFQSPSCPQSIAFRHFDAAGGTLQPTDPYTKTRLKISGYARGTVATLSTPVDQRVIDMSGLHPRTRFLARVTTPQLNATGAGALYDVVFGSEVFDEGSDYDASTGIFTCRRPGLYSFFAQVLIADKSSSMTRADIRLVTTGETFTNTATVTTATNYPEHTLQINVPQIFMNIGDTAKVQVLASGGGGNTADVFGDSTIRFTYFCGSAV